MDLMEKAIKRQYTGYSPKGRRLQEKKLEEHRKRVYLLNKNTREVSQIRQRVIGSAVDEAIARGI